MGHCLFVLNVKQPVDTSEQALSTSADTYLTAQGFTGSDTYWGRGKCDWFEVGGNSRGVLQAAAAGVSDPESNNDLTASAVYQYNAEPALKEFLTMQCNDGEYHDVEYGDDISALETGDWLVAIDYHL